MIACSQEAERTTGGKQLEGPQDQEEQVSELTDAKPDRSH